MKRSTVALAVLGPLAIIAAVFFGWLIWRAFLPLQIAYNEAWNAWLADAALGAGPIYPGASEFIVNNYPPLSFHLVALIAKATGVDALYVGRMLSLLATVTCGLAAALCVRRFGGGRITAGVAGLWFIAALSRFHDAYVGMNDPNLLALALMGLALAWFLSRLENRRPVEPAIVAMVVAGFFKHTLLAIPLTALLWLAAADRRLAFRAALVGAAASAIALALCWLAYGGAFFEQMLMPREFSPRLAWLALDRVYWIVPALAIVAIWAWYDRRSQAARFVLILAALSFASLMLQRMGEGVDDNAQFELVFATAMGLGFAFDRIDMVPLARRFGADRTRIAIGLILVARLLWPLKPEPFLWIASPAYRQEIANNIEVMKKEVARIKAIPGPVTCTIMAVCRQAGKPYVWDHFWMTQRAAVTHSDFSLFEAQARARGVRFETIDPRAW
jgi:hypothetical protein